MTCSILATTMHAVVEPMGIATCQQWLSSDVTVTLGQSGRSTTDTTPVGLAWKTN